MTLLLLLPLSHISDDALHAQKECSVESLPTADVLEEPAETAVMILSM